VFQRKKCKTDLDKVDSRVLGGQFFKDFVHLDAWRCPCGPEVEGIYGGCSRLEDGGELFVRGNDGVVGHALICDYGEKEGRKGR